MSACHLGFGMAQLVDGDGATWIWISQRRTDVGVFGIWSIVGFAWAGLMPSKSPERLRTVDAADQAKDSSPIAFLSLSHETSGKSRLAACRVFFTPCVHGANPSFCRLTSPLLYPRSMHHQALTFIVHGSHGQVHVIARLGHLAFLRDRIVTLRVRFLIILSGWAVVGLADVEVEASAPRRPECWKASRGSTSLDWSKPKITSKGKLSGPIGVENPRDKELVGHDEFKQVDDE